MERLYRKITKRIKFILKTETVLSIAVVLAVISAFFIRPDRGYIDYIDFRTLSLLFCLMAVMAGLKRAGVFDLMAIKLLERVHSTKGIITVLILLCFFFSMFITNDVALITFVPFSFTVLDLLGKEEKARLILPLTVMETIAANLGSMMTPIGNPQNLYLQGVSGMGIGDFLSLMMPYGLTALAMLLVWIFLQKGKKSVELDLSDSIHIEEKKKVVINLLSFCVCLLTVGRILDYRITLVIVVILIYLVDKRIFKTVDYTLLFTFVAFFIFVGNLGRLSLFEDFIGHVVQGRECLTGVLSSQIISNVPAALLLSGFTDNYRALIVGVNLGGLGTLIASMASLISFKLVSRRNKHRRGEYMLYFTGMNVLFLVVLFSEYYIFFR